MRARVAILGAGFISDFHIRALRETPGAELVAICDSDASKATAAARRWAIPNCYRSVEEMRAGAAVDVVHVLVPPPHHATASLACLQAGWDLFLEKPLAATAAESREIKLAAEAQGRYAGVNHNALFHPAFQALIARIQSGDLGAVQHVTACVNVPLRQLVAGQHGHWMFQKPGNIVLEQAPHPLSQIQFLVGNFLSLESLPSGRMRLNTGSAFFDTWQVSGICERGTAQCHLAFGKEYFDSWLHVIGQDAVAMVDLRRNTLRVTGKTRFMEPVENLRLGWSNALSEARQATGNLSDYCLGFLKLKSAADPFYRGMRDSIRAFYDARARQAPAPASMSQALAVIEACEAIGQPARERAEAEMEKWEQVRS